MDMIANSKSRSSIKKERNKLATVAEEEASSVNNLKTKDQSNPSSKLKVKVNPLPLDQILTHVSKFGLNLDNLENKLTEITPLQLKLDSLKKYTEQASGRNGNNQAQGSQYMTASILQGV